MQINEHHSAGIHQQDQSQRRWTFQNLRESQQVSFSLQSSLNRICGFSWRFLKFLNRFQEACKKYGVPEMDVFQTIDLSEKKDIAMVTSTIFGLGSAVSF